MTNVFFLASVNIDILSYLEQFPQSGQTLSASDSVIACGGKGANQAFACSQNDVEPTMLCKLGDDAFGMQAREFLRQRKKVKAEILSSDKNTAIAQIFVRQHDSQNMIVLVSGANKDIKADEVERYQQQIKKANLLVVQLENNIEAIAAAINLAKLNQVPVLLNPAPYEAEIEPYLSSVDIITPNETEATELTGIKVESIETAKMAATAIFERYGIKKIVITLGAQGVYYLDKSFDNDSEGFVNAFSANVVDTSGAGDAFNGAFAAHFSKHNHFIDAIEYANAYASTAVEGKGASYMPESSLAYKRIKE